MAEDQAQAQTEQAKSDVTANWNVRYTDKKGTRYHFKPGDKVSGVDQKSMDELKKAGAVS